MSGNTVQFRRCFGRTHCPHLKRRRLSPASSEEGIRPCLWKQYIYLRNVGKILLDCAEFYLREESPLSEPHTQQGLGSTGGNFITLIYSSRKGGYSEISV
jgi:hypothetical protein